MPGEGQHAGMAASQKLKGWVNIQEYILQTLPNGWVNMQELAAKPQKTIGLGVGQHAGIVGQHEQEWWVNMGRNLQLVQYYRFFYLYYLKYSLKNADPHRSAFLFKRCYFLK